MLEHIVHMTGIQKDMHGDVHIARETYLGADGTGQSSAAFS